MPDMMSDAHALILALPQPVILVGQTERIIGVNDPAKRLIGMECFGIPYISALRQPALLDAVEAILNGADPCSATYLSTDGARDTTWDVSVQGAHMATKRVAVLSFQDLTALEEAEDMRRDFIANVSHEMRTPLTSLQGFIDTLRGPAKNDPAAQERFLGIMEQEAGRMNSLVEDLLSLSRVESEERIRPTTPVTLHLLIDEVLAALMPLAAAKDVTFQRDFAQDATQIIGDRDQLWQVISNLVENAIKYGAQGGTVVVGLSGPSYQKPVLQDGVQISVRDDGIGIPQHSIPRLTERFYRVDSHRSREVGGTGLGLAITKHIINRHRGRFRIQSVLGEGTEVTVILPISHGHMEQ